MVLFTAIAAIVGIEIIAIYKIDKVEAQEVKQIDAVEVNIDCPIYEMGDKNVMGLWQKGEYFLIFDPNTNVVYYPSNDPFISENGNFCKYTDGKLIEISK